VKSSAHDTLRIGLGGYLGPESTCGRALEGGVWVKFLVEGIKAGAGVSVAGPFASLDGWDGGG